MKKLILTLSIIIAVALGFMATPLFNIQLVNVYGNNIVSDAYIRSHVAQGNIFVHSSRDTREGLEVNPYIYRVTTRRNFTRRHVNVYVIEREQVAYIHFNNAHYLYIDREGRVLEVNTSRQSDLPVVVGLSFSAFTLGELLEIDNTSAFNTISHLAGLFLTYDIDTDMITIDVSQPNNTRLNYGSIIVNLGSDSSHSGMDEKLRTVLAILPSVSHFKNIGGTLNVSYLNGQWFFALPL